MSSFGIPIGRLYGPGWLNGQVWFPGFKCVWAAETDQSNHHCPDPECTSHIKTSCYEKLHVAFCLYSVPMPNGHRRFCGHRFQVESPKACALHGWGDADENRVFQRAKKGLAYELPTLFPHEQPGWEMVLSSFGSIQYPMHIRMGLVDSELCFVRVMSWLEDGQPDQVAEIARVKTKEMLLTETDPWVALAHKSVIEENPEKAIQALVRAEQNDDEFNNPFSYRKYTIFTLKAEAATKLEEKKVRDVRAAAQAAQRLVTTKGGKKGGQRRAVDAKELRTKGKKK